MQVHSQGAVVEDEARRWAELVALLRADADELIHSFVTRVRAIPPYGRGTVPADRLEADAAGTFEYLLRRIAGAPVPDRVADIGRKIGRDRARRGVPLNDLLTAVRLDFRVLWDGLRARSRAEDESMLVARVEDVWGVVEDYVSQIQVSYQSEAALLARERHGERSMLVATLLGEDRPDPDEVARTALALDVEVLADLLVVAAPAGAGALLRRAADGIAADGRPAHVQSAGRHAILIARWDGPTGPSVRTALAGVPCGVGPLAHGLAEVPRCARLATEVADAVPAASGPVEPGDAWLSIAAARFGPTSPDVVGSVLGGLSRCAPGERGRLLETVRAHARSGSVAEVARELYCHRNTVLNRLRRFTELTGRDVTVPAESAVVQLALACEARDRTQT